MMMRLGRLYVLDYKKGRGLHDQGSRPEGVWQGRALHGFTSKRTSGHITSQLKATLCMRSRT